MTTKPKQKRNPRPRERGALLNERLLAAALGFGFLAILAYAGLRDRPITDPGQLLLLRVVASVSSAACAAVIPGFINVRFRNWLRAGGAIAVFVIIWSTNPPQLLSPKGESSGHNNIGVRAGNFVFNCGDIEGVPFGATVGIDSGEHTIDAYSATFTLMGIDSLKLQRSGQDIVKSRLNAVRFDPLPEKPVAALATDAFNSDVNIRFGPGTTLRARPCDIWSGACVAVQIIGNWSAKLSTTQLSVRLNRYSTTALSLPNTPDEISAVANSQKALFAELLGEHDALIVVSSHRADVALPLYDSTLSDATDLKFSNCRSISGKGFDGKEFLSLKPTASTIVADTENTAARITGLRLSCRQMSCFFTLTAEGIVARLRQNNLVLWENGG